MRVDFWTNVEFTAYLRELSEALLPLGFELRPRFELRQARYWKARGRAARVALRLRTYIAYPLRVAWNFAFRAVPRVVIVTSNTFFVPWLAAILGGRRRRVIHLVYDLYPETLLLAGIIRENGWMARLLRWIVRDTFRRAAVNVMLGDRLAEYVRERYPEALGSDERLRIIPVGAVGPVGRADDESAPSVQRSTLNIQRPEEAGAKRVILYCGNMGYLHDVETVAEFLCRRGTGGVAWRFHATGAGYARFKELVSGKEIVGDEEPSTLNARLSTLNVSGSASPDLQPLALSPQPPDLRLGVSLDDREWAAAMRESDVALVTMKPGAEDVLMPSKAYSALLAGQAVLAICPANSDLADLVSRHDCGWVVPPGDIEALAAAIGEIAGDHEGLRRRQTNARGAGELHYGMAVLAQQWAELLQEVCDRCPDAIQRERKRR